jgi:hypothetical protein
VLRVIVLSVCMLIEPAHCKYVHLQVASELDTSLQVALNCMRARVRSRAKSGSRGIPSGSTAGKFPRWIGGKSIFDRE